MEAQIMSNRLFDGKNNFFAPPILGPQIWERTVQNNKGIIQ